MIYKIMYTRVLRASYIYYEYIYEVRVRERKI